MTQSATTRRDTCIGSPLERIEDLRFLRGRGQYVDDLKRPGALHAAQEFEFLAPVRCDERIEVAMSVAQQSVRAGSSIVVIASVLESAGVAVARARSTVMAPAAEAVS